MKRNPSKKYFEANVVNHNDYLEIFSDNNDLIRKLAQNVRKRIVIKADSSVRKPILGAKQKLSEILPEEAGIVDTRFDEINGDVILEASICTSKKEVHAYSPSFSLFVFDIGRDSV